jgi:hypothetical protein
MMEPGHTTRQITSETKFMKKVIFILIVIASITAACVKYEEGPLVSNLSVKKRIYGFHFLKEYTVNGADSLSQYRDSFGLRFDFFYDDISKIDVCAIEVTEIGYGANLYWTWELSSDRKFINVNSAGSVSIGIGPFGKNKIPFWEIIKLDKEQMKLKTNYNNKEYMMVLD